MVTQTNISILKQLNCNTLLSLRSVLERMEQKMYTHVNPKGRASVGQHVRHTLEFYQCLFEATDSVNYDLRKRDILLESSPDHAMICIDELIEKLNSVSLDRSLKLLAEMSGAEDNLLSVSSSMSRELLYVLEHAIHHMALMRVLIKDGNTEFDLHDSFGVAYSTLAYRSHEAKG
ncbi:MAG: DinB family protein [Flavobacteriales bacterium]|nr:DinB family protein [Flavobacteriales bacterium]